MIEETRDTFESLIRDQLAFGGIKYANTNEKEVTDVLCEDFGIRGLLWTLGKYIFRFRNQGKEKDLLKIGAYAYILWLKRGFHINPHGTDEIINTTVRVKQKHFNDFLNAVSEFQKFSDEDSDDIMQAYLFIKAIAREPFTMVPVYWLYLIWGVAERIWNEQFVNCEVRDTDTWNSDFQSGKINGVIK